MASSSPRRERMPRALGMASENGTDRFLLEAATAQAGGTVAERPWETNERSVRSKSPSLERAPRSNARDLGVASAPSPEPSHPLRRGWRRSGRYLRAWDQSLRPRG